MIQIMNKFLVSFLIQNICLFPEMLMKQSLQIFRDVITQFHV